MKAAFAAVKGGKKVTEADVKTMWAKYDTNQVRHASRPVAVTTSLLFECVSGF